MPNFSILVALISSDQILKQILQTFITGSETFNGCVCMLLKPIALAQTKRQSPHVKGTIAVKLVINDYWTILENPALES